MASPHFSAEQLAAYRAGRLSPDDVLELHDHVAACPDCRERLAASYTPGELAPFAEEHEVTEQELVDLVRGAAGSARARIERHLALCGECREAVAELRLATPAPRKAASGRHWLGMAAAVSALLIPAALWVATRPAEPRVLLSVAAGNGRLELREGGSLAGAAALPAADRELLAAVLSSGRLPYSAGIPAAPVAALRSPTGTDAPFSPVAPLDRRVLSASPRFEWTAARGAASYEVTVATGGLQEIARSGPVRDLSWTPGRPLPRGVPLRWQVAAAVAGQSIVAPAPPAPPAQFEIVGEVEAARIEDARNRAPGNRLLLAALYAAAGLREEASAELDALEQLNPGAEFVKSLRGSLK